MTLAWDITKVSWPLGGEQEESKYMRNEQSDVGIGQWKSKCKCNECLIAYFDSHFAHVARSVLIESREGELLGR
jgi:hypothetical protein